MPRLLRNLKLVAVGKAVALAVSGLDDVRVPAGVNLEQVLTHAVVETYGEVSGFDFAGAVRSFEAWSAMLTGRRLN